MRKKLTNTGIYAGVFIGIIALMVAALVAVAKIPESKLDDNLYASAKYLSDGEIFGCVWEDIEGSRIDRYADSILLNILYHYDSKNSLKSIMKSSYYSTPFHNENLNLFMTINQRLPAREQYIRYWHGSIVYLRPLFLFLDIQGIYVLNAVIIGILTLILLGLLIKDKAYFVAVGLAIGLIMCASWFVPFSLEYTWVFMIMLVASIIMFFLMKKDYRKTYGLFFMIVGMITNYMDFLSTETLTLFVPLLMMLFYRDRSSKKDGVELEEKPIMVVLFSTLKWGIGYVGTWVAKWVLAAIILHKNTLPYITEHISERLGKTVYEEDRFGMMTGAITRNIMAMFPMGYGTIGAIAGGLLIIGILYIGFVYRKEEFNGQLMLAYTLVAVIPYIRFLVLHNHAYLHCFFTYRVQVAVILAIVLILYELIDTKLLLRK